MGDMIGRELASAFIEAYNKTIGDEIGEQIAERRSATMKVSCNGFTGELVKLERVSRSSADVPIGAKFSMLPFDLSIYDSEKNVTHSFAGIKLENVKFLGGAVTFGG